MSDKIIAGVDVDLDPEGYFTAPETWVEEMAPQLAAEEGLGQLSEEHWQVIKVMREEYRRAGSGPAVRALSRVSGIPIKRLYELFPGGPAKVAARIAGIPKPRGCI